MARTIIWVSLLVMSGCASSPHPWSHASVCERELHGNVERETWLQLLLQGFDPGTGRATSPAVDCSGTQVRWDAPAFECADPSTASAMLPERPLTAEDVVVEALGDETFLVWVITNRFASGDGLGPVAVAKVHGSRVTIRAIGPLRANLTRPRLRLEKVGASEFLVAEGEQCAGRDVASCTRAARVLPLAGTERFRPSPVTDAAGTCMSGAWVYLSREETEKLPSGWLRRYRLDATLAFGADSVTVGEQVAIHDLDPKDGAPPRLFRRAENDRKLVYDGIRLVADQPALWTKMMSARE